MRLERLDHYGTIRDFFQDKELWKRVSEDGMDSADLKPDMLEHIHWVGFYDDDESLIGIMHIAPESLSTCVVHINILKEYRYKHSATVGNMGMAYLQDSTDFWKFHVAIAEQYGAVRAYVVGLGFLQEGIRYQSLIKDGKYVDQYLYGLDRIKLELHNKLRGI